MVQLTLTQKKLVFVALSGENLPDGEAFASLPDLIEKIKIKKPEAYFLAGCYEGSFVKLVVLPPHKRGGKIRAMGYVEEVDRW